MKGPVGALSLAAALAAAGSAAAAVAGTAATGAAAPAGAQTSYECTLVVGYSQAAQWFEAGGVFETVVDDAIWELKWAGGAGVDRWSDPDDRAWEAEILSPCARLADEPDRIVLSISGPHGDDEEAWARDIRATVDLLKERFPSARRIVLVPVVGGPEHADCTFEGRRVRASWQHAHVDEAIRQVIQDDPSGTLVGGPSPEVRTCNDYRDALGHLTDEGAEAVARELGGFFRRRR